MKKTLQYVPSALLLIVALLSGQALAQTPANKSRLDIKPKAKSSVTTGVLPFPTWLKTTREVSLSRSPSITSFYRNQLITQPPRPTVPRAATRSEVPVAATPVLVAESHRTGEVLLPGVEKMYSNEKITVSNLYPNPANEYAFVDYAITGSVGEAKISLYSALGSSVNEFTLDRNEHRLKINTSDIPNGVYLYQLSLEGKTVVTKKLLVRHH